MNQPMNHGWGQPLPPVHGQYGPPPPKKSKAPVVVMVIVIAVAVLGVAGFFALRAYKSGALGSGGDSGEQHDAPSGLYSVRIPKTVRKAAPRKDTTIPSRIELTFVPISDKGGVIKVGTTAEDMAREPVDEIGEFVAQNFRDSPQGWDVEKTDVTVDGRQSVLVNMKTKEDAVALEGNGMFTRFYFIPTAPGGEVVLVSCDWNTESQDVGAACDHLINSLKISSGAQ